MSADKDHDKYLKELEAYLKKETSTKKKTLDFLHRAGILTKKGNLTSKYKTPVKKNSN